MPSKKDIKTRIRAIENTQKVTKSMKLIAIIKLKQVQNAFNATKPFTNQLANLLIKTVSRIDLTELDQDKLPKLVKPPLDNSSVCLVVVSSDRGLCGPYNAQLFKSLSLRIKQLKSEGKKIKLVLLGNKVISFANRFYKDCEVIKKFSQIPVFPPKSLVDEIYSSLEDGYSNGDFGKVEIFYSNFISMIKSSPSQIALIPFKLESQTGHSELEESNREILFEPHPETILNALVPLYCKNQLHQAMLSGRASELSNRVNAMTSATDNAKALITDLKLTFNKARQAAITQEISEIVAGAESVN
ncbi:MAG: ATP synthase F1 subunit gamma [Candidatus Caenarcaniphilales bacterium]|nr:ATP synthase F1 subunit gamma [Candidatus Caenarcaniphilales bacterium]